MGSLAPQGQQQQHQERAEEGGMGGAIAKEAESVSIDFRTCWLIISPCVHGLGGWAGHWQCLARMSWFMEIENATYKH